MHHGAFTRRKPCNLFESTADQALVYKSDLNMCAIGRPKRDDGGDIQTGDHRTLFRNRDQEPLIFIELLLSSSSSTGVGPFVSIGGSPDLLYNVYFNTDKTIIGISLNAITLQIWSPVEVPSIQSSSPSLSTSKMGPMNGSASKTTSYCPTTEESITEVLNDMCRSPNRRSSRPSAFASRWRHFLIGKVASSWLFRASQRCPRHLGRGRGLCLTQEYEFQNAVLICSMAAP